MQVAQPDIHLRLPGAAKKTASPGCGSRSCRDERRVERHPARRPQVSRQTVNRQHTLPGDTLWYAVAHCWRS